MKISVDAHELLDLVAFTSSFPQPLGELHLDDFQQRFSSQAPVTSNDEIRTTIRQLLRLGGFRPAGRSKPASEYLLKAVENETLGSINLAVDICNLVSYHSGLPISVVDVDKLQPPLRVGLAQVDDTYVFNASGQSIDVAGLLCLFDAEGPCANAVKDAQRTKTDSQTRGTLTLIWSSLQLPERGGQVSEWYRRLLADHDVATEICWPQE